MALRAPDPILPPPPLAVFSHIPAWIYERTELKRQDVITEM